MGFLSSWAAKALAILGAIAAVIWGFDRIQSRAKQSGRDERDAQNAGQAIKNVETRNDVETDIAGRDSSLNRDRLSVWINDN